MPKGSGITQTKKLSAELADIVGVKEASRPECVKLLWAYLKKNNLQVRKINIVPIYETLTNGRNGYKSISRIIFLSKFHFFLFQKWRKINF